MIALIDGVIRLSPDEWDREQAIRVGLLLRIRRFLKAILCLRNYEDTGEAMFALSRLVMESAMNLRYLLFKDDPEMYAVFVTSALRADVDLLDEVEENIRQRGGTDEMPIEKRMKSSVLRYVQDSGTTLEDVRSSPKGWGPSYRERLREMGVNDAYLYIQSIPSSAVHGDWSSLFRFHIGRREGGYGRSQPESIRMDGLLNPLVAVTCGVIVDYAEAVHPGNEALVRSARLLQATVMEAEEGSGDFVLEDAQSDGNE
ncbi:MAG: hypothetical protein F4152_01275 [Dehalococcoidia bacterium]|nr:hypothetical protein [Dehalococcoidia bacterium]